MDNMIKVSVIIPTCGSHEYIWQCFDSICCQSIGNDRIEIIVIVNGCKLPFVKQIEYYLKKKEIKHTVVLQSDIPSVSNARNMGISIAQGEWICFIDDDDWITDKYLENLVNTGGDKAHVVEANVCNYNESNDCYQDDYLTKAFLHNANKQHISLLSGRKFMSSSCCKIIKRTIIQEKRFDCRFKQGEDALFMATISNKIKEIKTASPDTIYYRRIRPNSASRSSIPLSTYIRNSTKLLLAYTKVYMSAPAQYNFIFFITRGLALVKNCFFYFFKSVRIIRTSFIV